MAFTAQVVNLPELLEAILLELPTRDLLLAQRVCTNWRTAITTSPNLQKMLFFKPGAANDTRPTLRVYVDQTAIHGADAVATNQLLICNLPGLRPSENSPVVRRNVLEAWSDSSCHRMFITKPPMALTVRFDYMPLQWSAECPPPFYHRVQTHETFGGLADLYSEFDDGGGEEVRMVQLFSEYECACFQQKSQ
ncbi:hypothetical protein LTS10_004442 [Elasticomyces elasticus]|nr:hypothetical protein LTS10_004442 [Elasticomyces elasticus]